MKLTPLLALFGLHIGWHGHGGALVFVLIVLIAIVLLAAIVWDRRS